jgi:hypothetical protein
MHYKNGREAKAGDKVVRVINGSPISGVIHTLNAQSDTCNARLARVSENDPYVTLKECLHIDDIAAAEIPSAAT